jgi:hypothetical protein
MSDDVVYPPYISSEAQDLIGKFLNRIPEKRLTNQEEMRYERQNYFTISI